ncbi:MAG: hypothetical protein Kow0089_06850 [Desulfobulbaceae bacterium]
MITKRYGCIPSKINSIYSFALLSCALIPAEAFIHGIQAGWNEMSEEKKRADDPLGIIFFEPLADTGGEGLFMSTGNYRLT